MVLGVSSAAALPVGAAAAAGLALAGVAAGWVAYARRADRAAFLAVLAAVAACGAARLAVHDRAYRANALHRYEAADYVEIVGRLARSPGRDLDRDVLVIDVKTVGARGEERPVRGRLMLTVPFARDKRPRFDGLVGDRIRASVRLGSGAAFRNFGAFSYERYLQGIGVHRRASTKTSLLVERAAPPPSVSLRRRISGVRRSIQAELERRFPAPDGRDISPAGAVLEALLLGEDGRLDEATVENLRQTGLYHLFAISGGHIAIVAGLLFALFRLVRLPRRASGLALGVFLVFYTLLVEGSPSVLRATLMTLAVLAGRLLWKDVHILNAIAASAFALLLANPSSLFDAGFQLTYAATLTIILFTPPLLRRLPRLPFKLTELALLSVTASLGAGPIIARSFNRVSLSSLLLNLAAVPLVGLIMGAGYGYLPFAAVFPGLAAGPAAALGVLVEVFRRVAHALDAFPFLSFRVPTPPPAVLAGYFAGLGLVLVRPRFRGQRQAAAAFAVFFALAIAVAPFRPASPDLRVTLIDVGQGESVLVEFPGRRVMLIDGGGLAGAPFDVGERVVSPVLWRKGIKRIDTLVLTHAHPDHLAGLVAAARNFRIGEVWEGPPPPNEGLYAAFSRALGPRVVRRRVGRGDRFREGPVAVDVLHPPPDETGPPAPAANEGSLVIRLTWGRVSFLLMADTGLPTERALLRSGDRLRAAVLQAGHHGSAGSTSAELLAAVRPRLVLVSAGAGNTYGFPSPAVLARCREAGAEVLRTDVDGAVEVRTDGRRLRVRRAAAPRPEEDPDSGLTRPTK